MTPREEVEHLLKTEKSSRVLTKHLESALRKADAKDIVAVLGIAHSLLLIGKNHSGDEFKTLYTDAGEKVKALGNSMR